MLAALYASARPEGLEKLIICNSPASMTQWVKAADGLRLVSFYFLFHWSFPEDETAKVAFRKSFYSTPK